MLVNDLLLLEERGLATVVLVVVEGPVVAFAVFAAAEGGAVGVAAGAIATVHVAATVDVAAGAVAAVVAILSQSARNTDVALPYISEPLCSLPNVGYPALSTIHLIDHILALQLISGGF